MTGRFVQYILAGAVINRQFHTDLRNGNITENTFACNIQTVPIVTVQPVILFKGQRQCRQILVVLLRFREQRLVILGAHRRHRLIVFRDGHRLMP